MDASFARSQSSFCWNSVSAKVIANSVKVLQPSADSQKLTYDALTIVYHLAIPLHFPIHLHLESIVWFIFQNHSTNLLKMV